MFFEITEGKNHYQVSVTQLGFPSLNQGDFKTQMLSIAILRRYPGISFRHMLVSWSFQNTMAGDDNNVIEGERRALRRVIGLSELLWGLSKNTSRHIWLAWLQFNHLPIPEKMRELVSRGSETTS